MFSIMFLVFRLIVAFTFSMGIEFMIKPININFEIPMLFIMLISIILISKNKLAGAIIFMAGSLSYFGPSLLQGILVPLEAITLDSTVEIIVSMIGVLIPIFAFFIIIFAKKQERKPIDQKTDFFYKNEAYDRKYDERADRNHYRTLE